MELIVDLFLKLHKLRLPAQAGTAEKISRAARKIRNCFFIRMLLPLAFTNNRFFRPLGRRCVKALCFCFSMPKCGRIRPRLSGVQRQAARTGPYPHSIIFFAQKHRKTAITFAQTPKKTGKIPIIKNPNREPVRIIAKWCAIRDSNPGHPD